MYLGQWEIDDLLTFSITTHTAATGAITDADAAPAYRVYEDETGTAILTGTMAKLDDTNTTGHYSEQITLSAANGFENGKTYTIYITATVATVVGGTTRTFQVEAAKATAAALQVVDDLVDDLETRLSATRAGYLDNLSAGAVALEATAQAVLTDTGTTLDALIKDIPTVAEFEARTIAAADYATASALATVDDFLDTEIAAILEDTGTTLPNQIAGLNNLSAAQVNAEVDTALADYDAPTKAELDAGLAGLNDIDATEAQAAAAAALAAYNAATEGDVTGLSIPTAATIADAVWDEATAGHATAGSTGAALTAAGNAGDPWGTLLPGAYGAGTAGAIVGGWDDSVFTAVATAAAVNGSNLSIHRGDTFSASITGLGDIQNRTQLYWTVKEHTSQADTAAVVQVEEDAGLMVLKGATAATAGDGDITVTNAATGAITLTLAAAATAELTPGNYYYDVQQVTASGVETLTAARLTVVADVTRAVA